MLQGKAGNLVAAGSTWRREHQGGKGDVDVDVGDMEVDAKLAECEEELGGVGGLKNGDNLHVLSGGDASRSSTWKEGGVWKHTPALKNMQGLENEDTRGGETGGTGPRDSTPP